jgi:Skp family chaperone for outer membrane proteins
MTRLLCFISLLLIASSASAQTARERDICARDVTRFCRSVMNESDDAVLACLQQHRHRISRACDKLMSEHGR